MSSDKIVILINCFKTLSRDNLNLIALAFNLAPDLPSITVLNTMNERCLFDLGSRLDGTITKLRYIGLVSLANNLESQLGNSSNTEPYPQPNLTPSLNRNKGNTLSSSNNNIDIWPPIHNPILREQIPDMLGKYWPNLLQNFPPLKLAVKLDPYRANSNNPKKLIEYKELRPLIYMAMCNERQSDMGNFFVLDPLLNLYANPHILSECVDTFIANVTNLQLLCLNSNNELMNIFTETPVLFDQIAERVEKEILQPNAYSIAASLRGFVNEKLLQDLNNGVPGFRRIFLEVLMDHWDSPDNDVSHPHFYASGNQSVEDWKNYQKKINPSNSRTISSASSSDKWATDLVEEVARRLETNMDPNDQLFGLGAQKALKKFLLEKCKIPRYLPNIIKTRTWEDTFKSFLKDGDSFNPDIIVQTVEEIVQKIPQ